MTDPDTEMSRAIRFKFINDCEKPNVVALDRLVDNIAQALRSVRQAENVDPEQVNELMKTLAPSLSSFERNFCAYKLTERLNKGDLRHNRLKEKP